MDDEREHQRKRDEQTRLRSLGALSHMLPVLGAIENHYRDSPVVVIGVHTPKFPAEREARRVQDAMDRMGVAHPVLLDGERRVWEEFGVHAWPTLVLVDPALVG